MNSKKCKQLLDLGYLQAFAEGKLQYKNIHGWETSYNLSFEDPVEYYRIKPEIKPYDFLSLCKAMTENGDRVLLKSIRLVYRIYELSEDSFSLVLCGGFHKEKIGYIESVDLLKWVNGKPFGIEE